MSAPHEVIPDGLVDACVDERLPALAPDARRAHRAYVVAGAGYYRHEGGIQNEDGTLTRSSFSSLFAQSVTGVTTYNAQQVDHHEATVTWLGYVGSADFWKATLENWQSEFLAVGSFVALTVFLRQRGSTQSKPVGAPHHSTGVEG